MIATFLSPVKNQSDCKTQLRPPTHFLAFGSSLHKPIILLARGSAKTDYVWEKVLRKIFERKGEEIAVLHLQQGLGIRCTGMLRSIVSPFKRRVKSHLPFAGIIRRFNVYGSVHCKCIPVYSYIQQDATLHNLFISGNYATHNTLKPAPTLPR
jgi:hypothetical protein